MRVLLYGINYAPELTGIGKYSGELGAWLAARGHEVRVVTAPPYYPAWEVGAGYSGTRYQHETIAGVAVWRCPLWVPRRLSGLRRVLHLASFALSSLPLALFHGLVWRPDVVFVVEPAFFCVPGAWLSARLGGATAWLHVQDYEMDAAFELGMLPGGALRRLVGRIESFLMRRFDRISTISAPMVARAVAKGVAPVRVRRFDNWVDVASITPDPAAGQAMRTALGLPHDRVVALYSGNMGEKQGLDVLIEAARRAPEICFVICGEGGVKAKLQAAAGEAENVRFLPLQPLERLNGLLNAADVHLLPQRADAADLVMPSKLTGMLASGRVTLATAHAGTAVADVVAASGGVVTPPEDAAAMAEALSRLAADPARRAEGGRAARAYALAYLGKDAILERLVDDFEAVRAAGALRPAGMMQE